MDAKELILMSLEQSQGYLTKALDGLTQEEAAWSSEAECNSIAFILWHVIRVEDFFMNRVIQRASELYEAEGWQEKLGTPERRQATSMLRSSSGLGQCRNSKSSGDMPTRSGRRHWLSSSPSPPRDCLRCLDLIALPTQ